MKYIKKLIFPEYLQYLDDFFVKLETINSKLIEVEMINDNNYQTIKFTKNDVRKTNYSISFYIEFNDTKSVRVSFFINNSGEIIDTHLTNESDVKKFIENVDIILQNPVDEKITLNNSNQISRIIYKYYYKSNGILNQHELKTIFSISFFWWKEKKIINNYSSWY